MLYLNKISIYIPPNVKCILELSEETGLSKEEILIYQYIYKLKYIPLANNIDFYQYVLSPISRLLSAFDNIQAVRYFIYAHTSPLIAPLGRSVTNYLQENGFFSQTVMFATNMYKCVSFFKALEVLTVLLSDAKNNVAIISTGEIAYTPLLRVVPGSCIVGDVSTACLISCDGSDHHLLAVKTHFIPGFIEGVYLTKDQLLSFNEKFIELFSSFILSVINDAGLSILNISMILPHNVNVPTWNKIAKELGVGIDKIYLDNVSRYGHCMCSDPILNLHTALMENRLKKGDYYLIASCAMGFFFGVAIFQF